MPVPLILTVIGAASAIAGTAMAVDGSGKVRSANETIEKAEQLQQASLALFEAKSRKAVSVMDSLGEMELRILGTFERFSDYLERIQGRPVFQKIRVGAVDLEKLDVQELKKISKGANLLISGLGGAVAGTAGGLAAAGATTSAVFAFGTASTGAAISGLSGAAATNATLAAIGGGSLAAGGGGMALGSMVLGGAAAGVAIMFGGLIFEINGGRLVKTAGEAMAEARRTEQNVRRLAAFYDRLIAAAEAFARVMASLANKYFRSLERMIGMMNARDSYRWEDFSEREKLLVENTALYVGLLYNMCKVRLVKEGDGEVREVNEPEMKQAAAAAAAYLE